jgi:thiamine-phosphate pyrophosphorylase
MGIGQRWNRRYCGRPGARDQIQPVPHRHAAAAQPLRRGPYLVTRETADTTALLRVVRAALRGGVVMVQYRDKSTDAARRTAQALALRAVCAEHAVPLLVNDDVELALRVRAAGVHVGEHDADPAAARAALGDSALVGVSCYDDLDRARTLAARGASYLAFGAFFSSGTKPNARRASPELLRASAQWGLPRVAIGGITADNAAGLIAAGADLLAVVSEVFDAPDPERAARALARAFAIHGP